MILRSIIVAIFAVFAVAGAISFEAASTAEQMVDLGQKAQSAEPATALRLIERETRKAEASFAQPLTWHAGALDSYSRLQAQASGIDAGAARNDARTRSIDAAARAVRLSPVLPGSWYRLAEYGGSPVCEPAVCLDASFAATPLSLSADFACRRMQLAHELGAKLSATDPRIKNLALMLPTRRQFAKCLSFLGGSELFNLLLEMS